MELHQFNKNYAKLEEYYMQKWVILVVSYQANK